MLCRVAHVDPSRLRDVRRDEVRGTVGPPPHSFSTLPLPTQEQTRGSRPGMDMW